LNGPGGTNIKKIKETKRTLAPEDKSKTFGGKRQIKRETKRNREKIGLKKRECNQVLSGPKI